MSGSRLVGDRALLLELPDSIAAIAAADAARRVLGDQLEEIVPGHQTLLLVWKGSRPDAEEVRRLLEQITADDAALELTVAEPITIPVVYDGHDLDTVAATLGVCAGRVIELHAAPAYTVAFVGFMPGFPYLIGGDPLLALPRLATPRTEVPAGSVAVAAGYCGIYPKAAPGGWNLLGRTGLELFDPHRDPPALLAPGSRVRFIPS